MTGKIVEMTEEEYLRLQRMNGFANQLLANPKSAVLVEQAAKIVNPNIKTPRLDQEAAIQQPFTQLQESMAAIQKRLDDDAAARANDAAVTAAKSKELEGIQALRKDGWNDAGITEIQKIMTERGIADPRDAAIVLERRHPAPTPAMPGSNGSFNLNETINSAKPDEDIKKLLHTRGREANGLEAISNKMIADTLADIRSGQN